MFNGVTYNQCTDVENDNIPWCATEVNEDGIVNSGKWGNCNGECTKSNILFSKD